MPAPSNRNLYLGAGIVLIDLWVSGAKTGNWRHLGNVSKLEATPSQETVEMLSDMDGARGVYDTAVISSKCEVSMDLREFTPESLAIALGGSVTTWTQSSGTATDTSLGAVKKGYGLATGKNRITVTAVKKSSTTLVDAGSATGTGDYWVDSESGTIFFLETTTTSGLVDTDAVTWSGSYPAITSKPEIHGLTSGLISCSIKYVSAANQARGDRYEILIPQMQISGDGALALITRDYGTISLKGVAIEDTTQPAGARFWRQRVIV